MVRVFKCGTNEKKKDASQDKARQKASIPARHVLAAADSDAFSVAVPGNRELVNATETAAALRKQWRKGGRERGKGGESAACWRVCGWCTFQMPLRRTATLAVAILAVGSISEYRDNVRKSSDCQVPGRR